jgi:hypothetical protein
MKTQWGDWRHDKATNILTYGPARYNIRLNEIDSSAAMLDWIFQILPKNWKGDKAKIMFDLLQAFDDLLAPQQNFCSMGVERRKVGTA